MVEYIYWDFKDNPITEAEYISFLEKYYGNETPERLKRIKWYQDYEKYTILLAIEDGVVLGQSCAYSVNAIINGKVIEWWWSVDTFVLPSARGKGVGKGLQMNLHSRFENFSSLWYSKANGRIKIRCGAKAVCMQKEYYYPTTSFVSFAIYALVHKMVHKSIKYPILWNNKYICLNSLFSLSPNLRYEEVNFRQRLNELYSYMGVYLKQYDFYIDRNIDYLKWKYVDNPTLSCHCLYIWSQKQKLLGIIVFSDVFSRKVLAVERRVSLLLEVIYLNGGEKYKRLLLLQVFKYFIKKRISLDGILAWNNMGYYPNIVYPRQGTALLSTCSYKINHPYFSYSDQDMEQML